MVSIARYLQQMQDREHDHDADRRTRNTKLWLRRPFKRGRLDPYVPLVCPMQSGPMIIRAIPVDTSLE